MSEYFKRVILPFFILLCGLFCLLIFSTYAYSQAYINSSNDFFTAYNPARTVYIYNETLGSGSTSGRYYVLNYDKKVLQIGVPTLASSSMYIKIEGQVSGATTWGLLQQYYYSSVTTTDVFLEISEHLEYIRVGAKVVSNGTDSINIIGNFGTLRVRR